MADSRFFRPAGPFRLDALARAGEATPADGADLGLEIEDVAPLQLAGPRHISFLANQRYLATFEATRAGACVVSPDVAPRAPAGVQLLLSPNPYRSFALISQLFHPMAPTGAGIDPAAHIDPSVQLGEGCWVAAGAVIGAGACLGPSCHIGANAVVGPGVELGEGCVVSAGATITHAIAGRRVILYPGARVGQDGFGFAMDAAGHVRIPQLGRVIIGDDVEIGANTTIDRGAGPDTVIGTGTMIDNLVQIGHNVEIGRGCVIVSQVGISGSTKIGDHVVIGGHAGIAGHLTIGDGARISAYTGVFRDVPAGAQVVGFPAVPTRQFFRQVKTLERLAKKQSSDGAE